MDGGNERADRRPPEEAGSGVCWSWTWLMEGMRGRLDLPLEVEVEVEVERFELLR